MIDRRTLLVSLSVALAASLPAVPCRSQPSASEGEPSPSLAEPREVHLADVRQLTFGGENAEAYWSPDGSELIFQATRPGYPCDRIYRLSPETGEETMVSTGTGRTTCAYFTYPDGERILYSSTHLASPECPPLPDRSQGYVWPIYDSYDIFTARLDGSDLVRLTDEPGYDAEATVCPLDGSIVFTSVRDGDLELYRMDADGSNVRRLTEAPGYDGGAFFSPDCTQIVWRASRPAGDELADYQRLLAQGMIRPNKLEIWVAEADGTHARQVTYLDAASFAPFFHPSGTRILFSSNYGDPRGREFEIWAIDVDGTDLEQITHSEGFDGFPMFSPDGRWLAFASNRNNAAPRDTNVFVARWVEGEVEAARGAADRFQADVAWLAADARDGRGVGTAGLDEAAVWLADRFREIGLEPAGDSYLRSFQVTASVEVGAGTSLAIDGEPVAAENFRPAAFSASGRVEAPVAAAGYGIVAPDLEHDDYAGLDVEGKIVAVRRFVPPDGSFDGDAERRYSDLRHKAFSARERGAVGLIVVDLPTGDEVPDEAAMPRLGVDAGGDAGLPVVFAKRSVGAPLFAGGNRAEIAVELIPQKVPASNVVGVIRAPSSVPDREAVLIGAHYDHLGFGGSGSLAPDSDEPHNGADDNASGTAALLEAARQVAARRDELERDVWFAAFSGEESGLLGSTQFTREPPAGASADDLIAMINMDMVGRLRGNRLSVLGSDSAEEWSSIADPACREVGLTCQLGGDGYGPSDQTPFYAAGVPVLHLFTGVHDDYHKPSDDTERINAAGGARVGTLAAELALVLSDRDGPLTYKAAPAPPPRGDVRSFGASLGTVPDYAGPGEGVRGVLLAGVRPGSPAEKAGMQRGDLLVELAGHEIGDIYDFVFVLRQAKPGDKATAVVERDGRRIELVVTYGVSRGMR